MRMQQLALTLSNTRRGGARAGAGRKPRPAGARRTPHRAREKHQARHPVHVTLRASLRSLRAQHVVRTVLGALRDSNRESFRVAQYSIQDNHVHLLVEAENNARLSSGVRGLMVRIAKRVNRLLSRRGQFWADRWHGVPLTTPRQVRNALVYVLQNHRKHHASLLNASKVAGPGLPILDPASSAQWFDGFAAPLPSGFLSIGPRTVVPARSWLLAQGWRRRGLIAFCEQPRS